MKTFIDRSGKDHCTSTCQISWRSVKSLVTWLYDHHKTTYLSK